MSQGMMKIECLCGTAQQAHFKKPSRNSISKSYFSCAGCNSHVEATIRVDHSKKSLLEMLYSLRVLTPSSVLIEIMKEQETISALSKEKETPTQC